MNAATTATTWAPAWFNDVTFGYACLAVLVPYCLFWFVRALVNPNWEASTTAARARMRAERAARVANRAVARADAAHFNARFQSQRAREQARR